MAIGWCLMRPSLSQAQVALFATVSLIACTESPVDTSPSPVHARTDGTDDAYSPAWSPDGQWIAFDMSRNGVRDVYRMRPSDTDLQRLTSGTRIASFPSARATLGPPLMRGR